ncbi:MAG: phosphocarrier protein HPr [Candidatus Omnitrophica bacterium CG11_big_fil_rev_8_21_14_0_20_63_9]|nr:MAG: phosphocarrier protein HPr [Candidatus Omnitrophica bacterium CG11_big_fil_rev_8_21_14_0_20_63_9]
MVPCRLGLHLRVAALVVTLARKFQSDIRFCSNRLCVDAKSILGMLQLAAVRGERLSLVAHGPDAERAIQVLAELFETKAVLCKDETQSEEVPHGMDQNG